MIHAYLFLTSKILDRDGHGAEFQFHMHRINKIAGTNITIYHSFHAEVREYQQHWWRCDGACKNMRPFFGWVKRAMNRAPGKNDFWWSNHQKICGGNFIKVKEPEKTKKKRSKKGEGTDNNANKNQNQKADDNNPEEKDKKRKSKSPKKSYDEKFPGDGNKLGGDPNTTQSRLITEFFPSLKNKEQGEASSSGVTDSKKVFPNLNIKKEGSSSGTVDGKKKVPETPPLIQLEHDDFGWDDEDIIILDFDDMVAVNEISNDQSGPGSSKSQNDFPKSDIRSSKSVKRKSDEERPSSSKMIKVEYDNEIQIISSSIRTNNEVNPETKVLVDCPACTKKFTLLEINDHLDVCAV